MYLEHALSRSAVRPSPGISDSRVVLHHWSLSPLSDLRLVKIAITVYVSEALKKCRRGEPDLSLVVLRFFYADVSCPSPFSLSVLGRAQSLYQEIELYLLSHCGGQEGRPRFWGMKSLRKHFSQKNSWEFFI